MSRARRRQPRSGRLLGHRHARTGDLGDATGAPRDSEREAVQLDDGRDQAQPKSDALGLPALLRTIKAPEHDVALVRADARPRVADAHDAFAGAGADREID